MVSIEGKVKRKRQITLDLNLGVATIHAVAQSDGVKAAVKVGKSTITVRV